MDEKTNIQRVENMLYHICGCSPEEARQVLYKCLVNAEDKIKNSRKKNIEDDAIDLNSSLYSTKQEKR